MKPATVKVPDTLLLDPELSGSAKLLWMVWQLSAPDLDRAPATGPLEAWSGLARHTVLRGLAQLVAGGWLPAGQVVPAPDRAVPMPGDLLTDQRIGTPAKLLYGVLQLTPGFSFPTGQFTTAQVGDLAGMCPNTVMRAIGQLQQHGWVVMAREGKHSPSRFRLRNLALERQKAEVELAMQHINESLYEGETLMREYLSLIVDSDQFEDDATPGWLVNPFTGEELQLDRYYPPGVAFEYQGEQHFGPTARFPDKRKARSQRGRDVVKLGLCALRGVKLIWVESGDLTLRRMQALVGSLLPLRRLDGHELLIDCLEANGRTHRRNLRPARLRQGGGSSR